MVTEAGKVNTGMMLLELCAHGVIMGASILSAATQVVDFRTYSVICTVMDNALDLGIERYWIETRPVKQNRNTSFHNLEKKSICRAELPILTLKRQG
ncbi:hypothetical protein CEXT_720341 [Caerostris extrusa]|uniref:Uncharacterized protein n=1 Tax=Caerostris extrusa TaxID=172846 RepID=A0AAV4SKI1_CAEEX|nr:hypothetical protein CEXT_720341 [Caerostris extrusa]